MAARDVGPLLQMIRKILMGREFKQSLRFQDKVATRSPPPPHLPDGPSHKLAANYYYARDGRRESRPPVVIAESSRAPALTSGIENPTAVAEVKRKRLPTPGQPYIWKESPDL